METVLTRIIDDKRQWLIKQKRDLPLESFKNKLTLSDRHFYQALLSTQTAFILECKKASPSKGTIREHFDLDGIASIYRHYANVISVLTDEKYFQGDFAFITQVRAQVPQPILCKDFMIDSYQVYLARYHQADAILLMLSVLDDEQYRELASVATSLNLGILTEVSNQAELERAIALNAKVVGINHRNLHDLSIDLNRTKILAPQLPKSTIVIAESGVNNHQQVKHLSHYANGFLIGSSLMSEDNLELAVRKIILGENKVCGLTSPEDAQKAYQAGAYFGGLIFAKRSKRQLSLAQAMQIKSAAPLNYVGVFQDQPLDFIVDTAKKLQLTAIQLHGREEHTFIAQLRKHLPPSCQIWKAYGVSNALPTLLTENIDRHLFDTKIGEQLGGTGQCFDWSLLTEILKKQTNIMLAGGIGADNAKFAASFGTMGLDLNSAVEMDNDDSISSSENQITFNNQTIENNSFKSRKDQQKLDLAFKAIRNY